MAEIIKKKYLGQHFLRQQEIVDKMVNQVATAEKTILEIGCGDGFLTKTILANSQCKKLISVEVDSAWAQEVATKITDPRLTVINADILTYPWDSLANEGGVVLLANLPYNITFPILHLLIKNRQHFTEGVFMVQEEVAQKITAQKKGVSAITIFMQAYLELKLLDKVRPEAFVPPPKVFSRTVYFRPQPQELVTTKDPEGFWKFVQLSFRHPRQTLRNNFKKAGFKVEGFAELTPELLEKRAQHLKLADFLKIWQENNSTF